MENVCAKCRHWDEIGKAKDGLNNIGFCRRYAPQSRVTSAEFPRIEDRKNVEWPVTMAIDWCCEFIPITLCTQKAKDSTILTRQPDIMPTITTTKDKGKRGVKTQFMLDLLKAVGSQGITWEEMQSQLKAKFGSAPKNGVAFICC